MLAHVKAGCYPAPMKSIKRKINAWHRRIAKERPQVWTARYRYFSDRAFANLVPVPATAQGARAKIERLERHQGRLHALKPPYASGRLDLLLDSVFRNLALFPSRH